MSSRTRYVLRLRPRCSRIATFGPVLLAICVLAFTSLARADDSAQQDREFREQILPLLSEHCLDCHSGAEADAGLSLEHFETPLDLLKERSVANRIVEMLKLETMPPPDVSELANPDRQTLIAWITDTIENYDCGREPDPGRVTLRRLNASEYQNTIRDLFGLPNFQTSSVLPGDDVGYGFDNIGDVLSLPPLLMEKYLLEAERISHTLIQTPPPAKIFEASYSGSQLQIDKSGTSSQGDLVITSNGTASFKEQIPWAGTYQLTISASGDQVGREPVQMAVIVDGNPVRRLAVTNPAESPKDFLIPLRLRAGSREVGIAFLNDFYQPASAGAEKLDRNLIIHHVSLVGKQSGNSLEQAAGKGREERSSYHRAIVFTEPANDGDRQRATRAVLFRLASRAFRRPVENRDLQPLVDLAMSVQEDGDSFEESIQVALQAILISPKFLFRVEPPAAGLSFQRHRDLDEFELATRISYFLWSSMPDSELFSAARQKQLRNEAQLQKQINRMIQDPRASQFIENFAGQWLTLRRLADFQPNAEAFPKWNERIKQLVEYETLRFFAEVMRQDLSVLRLLDADFTYVNEELARFYGIPNVRGKEFRRVSLEGTNRAGLLTQASVLAVTSNPTRTSPVKRGKWILETLLNMPPPMPPPGVPELPERSQVSGSLRQQLEQHRVDPACSNCHQLMDPLGFALEHFDAVGLYRTRDGIYPVDALGELPGGQSVHGAKDLRQLLVEKYRDEFVRCLTEKMLTYALGRGLEYYDQCAVDKIVSALEKNDYRFSTLLLEIVRSDPFQKKGGQELP